LRYLMTLATGAFAVLIPLTQATPNPSEDARLTLRILWGSLSLAILLGSFALRGELLSASIHRARLAQKAKQALEGGAPPFAEHDPATGLIFLPRTYALAQSLFHIFLCASLVLFTLYACL
jgi:hypothetical protein